MDDIPYHRYGSLYVDGKLLEAVPCLAIVVNLGKDIGPMLFHCDEEWNALGTSGNQSVAAINMTRSMITPALFSAIFAATGKSV